jgi:hypothetical protein
MNKRPNTSSTMEVFTKEEKKIDKICKDETINKIRNSLSNAEARRIIKSI